MEISCICGKCFEDNKRYLGHRARCSQAQEQHQKLLDELLPKEKLINWFEHDKKSAKSLADTLNCKHVTAQTIINRAKFFGIKTHTIQESKNLDSVKTTIKLNNMQKYGHEHNFCKNHPSRIKWEKALLETEGISNVFQRDDVKNKSKETMMERYGVTHPMFVTELINKMIATKINTNSFGMFRGSISKLHLMVCGWLEQSNIKFIKEFHLYKYDVLSNKKGWYSYDILIANTNKFIEVNGDYFHANPKIYLPNDILNTKRGLIKANDIWEQDRLKLEFAKKAGYDVFYVWETDIKENEILTKNKILAYVNFKN